MENTRKTKSAHKIQYHNDVLNSKSIYNTNQIAEELGVPTANLNRYLFKQGIQYRRKGIWLLYKKHQDKGYTKTKTNSHICDYVIKTSTQTFWTEKGRFFIHHVFSEIQSDKKQTAIQ